MTVRSSEIRKGMTVYDVDGEKVGTVDEVGRSAVRLSSGFLGLGGGRDLPLTAFASQTTDELRLSMRKDQLDERGSAYASEDPERHPASRPGEREQHLLGQHQQDRASAGGARREEDGATVQLREEELLTRKEMREAGSVNVQKKVVSEQRTMEVPVSREEVVVERHPVERRPADRPIGEGEMLKVPISEETVTPEKRTVVGEEVTVGKRAVQEMRRVQDSVRKEVVDIDAEGGAELRGERDH